MSQSAKPQQPAPNPVADPYPPYRRVYAWIELRNHQCYLVRPSILIKAMSVLGSAPITLAV